MKEANSSEMLLKMCQITEVWNLKADSSFTDFRLSGRLMDISVTQHRVEGENRNQVYCGRGCLLMHEDSINCATGRGPRVYPLISLCTAPPEHQIPPHSVSLVAPPSIRRRNYWNDAENYHFSPSTRQTDRQIASLHMDFLGSLIGWSVSCHVELV